MSDPLFTASLPDQSCVLAPSTGEKTTTFGAIGASGEEYPIMTSALATIPGEIIDCIAHGREPLRHELVNVANHIWSDVSGGGHVTSVGMTGALGPRFLSSRAAQTALSGSVRP